MVDYTNKAYFDHSQACSQAVNNKEFTLTTSTLPLPLTEAINNISSLVDSLKYARAACIRAMRPERRQAIKKLLTAMLQSCSLQHNGAICAVNENWARPKTIQELAHQAGLSLVTAKRAMHDLYALELVASKQIKRKGQSGKLEVSPAMRFFTRKFWEKVGLLDMWEKSVSWAKVHANKKFILPFRQIVVKARQVTQKAGNVIKTVMGKLENPAQPNKIQEKCSWIMQMLKKE